MFVCVLSGKPQFGSYVIGGNFSNSPTIGENISMYPPLLIAVEVRKTVCQFGKMQTSGF